MSDVFTVTERIAAVDDEIAEVEVMKRVREATGGAYYCDVFIDRLGELYAERRDLAARRLNDEIEALEKQAIVIAMTGRWTDEHDTELGALYDARRRVSVEKGTDDE